MTAKQNYTPKCSPRPTGGVDECTCDIHDTNHYLPRINMYETVCGMDLHRPDADSTAGAHLVHAGHGRPYFSWDNPRVCMTVVIVANKRLERGLPLRIPVHQI